MADIHSFKCKNRSIETVPGSGTPDPSQPNLASQAVQQSTRLHSTTLKPISLRNTATPKPDRRQLSNQPHQQVPRPVRDRASDGTLLARVRIKEGGHGDDDVSGNQQGALEVVAATIENEEIDDESRNEERDGLEEGKVEGHVFREYPAEENYDGGDEEGCIGWIVSCMYV